MMKKLILCVLLCVSAFAADKVAAEKTVTGADGKQYKLVKAEAKLPNGAISIAEYVRVGDKESVRYGMKLTPKGVAPSFWKIQG